MKKVPGPFRKFVETYPECGMTYEAHSAAIRSRLDEGHIGEKPGWVRISLSPTVSEEEFQALLEAVDHVARKGRGYEKDYELRDATGEWARRAPERAGA